MNKLLRFAFYFIFSVSTLSAMNVYAECSPYDTEWTVNPGNITVHSSDPVGTTYLKYTMDYAGYACFDSNAMYQFGVKSYAASLSYRSADRQYFDTGVPGLGFSLAAIRGEEEWITPGHNYYIGFASSLPGSYYFNSAFEFSKTGDIIAGSFYSGVVAAYIVEENSTLQPETPIYMGTGSVTVIQDSCNINQPTLNTSLGTWNVQHFTGIGTQTTNTPVNLSFSCGSAGVKVLGTISADADTTQPGTIKLSPGTTSAEGLGVQIVDSQNKPVPLNTEFTITSSANAGVYTPGWNARYIQTASNVYAGAGDAGMTVTFSYE